MYLKKKIEFTALYCVRSSNNLQLWCCSIFTKWHQSWSIFFPNTALYYKFSSLAPAFGGHAPHIIRDENRATRAKTELLLKAVHHNERGKWRALKNAVSNLSGKISFWGWRLKCVSKLNPWATRGLRRPHITRSPHTLISYSFFRWTQNYFCYFARGRNVGAALLHRRGGGGKISTRRAFLK